MTVNVFNKTFRRLTSLLTPGPAIRVSRVLWPLMLVVDDLLLAGKRLIGTWIARDWLPPVNLSELLQYDYDVRIVPYRAQHPGLLARLVHQILRAFGIVFVVNMVPGMGHNTPELDSFLRLLKKGLIPPKRYVLLRLPSAFHDDTLALYRKNFWFASNNVFLRNLFEPVVARYKDLQLNVGLSRLRWQLKDDGSWTQPPAGQTFFYQVSKAENREAWMRYYRLRHETRDISPLKDGLTVEPALLDFFGGSTDRLALVHVKYHVMNATARPTDPRTYESAIRWLQAQGYRVVMIGREKMPEEFSALGVLDYAGSPLACYRFDLELASCAAVAITAGSGVALMPDCMNVPLVYLNSWHIGMPLASERCVMVPTLVKERSTGRWLSFAEQRDLYLATEDKGDEVFPADDYEPREATGDEILEAVKEALSVTARDPLTARQQSYHSMALKDQGTLVDARVSRYFIDRHAHLLET